MAPRQTQQSKGKSKSAGRKAANPSAKNADSMDRHARYREKNREEINRKKREKMREKRAAEYVDLSNFQEQHGKPSPIRHLQKAPSPQGQLPWLQSTEELACAEVLTSLRSYVSRTEETPDAVQDAMRRDMDETIRAAATYTELDGWKYLLGLRSLVHKWGSIWGGVLYWPDAMEEMFLSACECGRTSVMNLGHQVWDHAEEGRRLLHEIEKMDGRLPDEPRALKILWIEYSKLHHVLIRGITIIEARMHALDSGIFRLPGVPIDSDDEDADYEGSQDEESGRNGRGGSEEFEGEAQMDVGSL